MENSDYKRAKVTDRPLMLAPGRYAQWQSQFLIYVDTKPNKKELRICIFEGPYIMTEVTVPAKLATTTKEAVPEHNVPETYKNTTPKKYAYFDAEAKAIHMILSGIGDGIYSTVDACTTAKYGESIKLYYSRFYKMMNEMYQNEVNEFCAKKIARNANLLALVAATQHYPDYHHQAPMPSHNQAPSSRKITLSNSHATTRNKGKEVVKPVTPPFESASKEDSDEEQA
nr:hypothetical protein [Tanacetum cinerariifolium]